MLLLGYDIGSSSIKATAVDAETGETVAFAQSPGKELNIQAPKSGWAEQNPEVWWQHSKIVTAKLLESKQVSKEAIKAIGLSYQMHGLVLIDENRHVLRPSIIWCDGRAVDIGKNALNELGKEYSFNHLLNSPGNFTASKLKWVKMHEPDIYKRIYKFMLPGDYMAMKLSGRVQTTVSGLSEAILWDYKKHGLATELLELFGISKTLVPEVLTNFGEQSTLSKEAAGELGLTKGTPITYRAGDQPNNALSLNVLDPGEVASTAGTSGVIYGVTDEPAFDEQSRVNTFVHVNHDENKNRYGVLLCINGTGIQNSWLRNEMLAEKYDYQAMNKLAGEVPVGSDGLVVIPFGNGPERVLRDNNTGAHFRNINFNRHQKGHLIRAAQEGIAYSLNYGLQRMKEMGMEIKTIRAGASNMYLSPVFRNALCNTSNVPIELFDTSGAQGAAIGAGIGLNIFESREEAFKGLKKTAVIEPEAELQEKHNDAYQQWKSELEEIMD